MNLNSKNTEKKFRFILTINNPIIQNHLVDGKSLLPGLAYIDMLYQIIQTIGFDIHKTALKNLSIYNPLIIENDFVVELTIHFKQQGDYFEVIVEGVRKTPKGKILEIPKKYMSAEFHYIINEIPFNCILNIDNVKKKSLQKIDLESGIYIQAREKGLIHKNIIKANGTIYLTEDGCVSEINVPEKYITDTKDYLFHPTLMDGSGMATSIITPRIFPEWDDYLYLPMFFEYFFSTELLQTHCYARLLNSNIKIVNEVIYYSIEFFNAEGKQVGAINRLACKRIRVNNQITIDKIHDLPQQQENIPLINHFNASEKNSFGKFNSIEMKLTNIFGKYLSLKPEDIDTKVGFFDLGLGSAQLLEILKEIEILLGVTLNPTLLFEYNSIQELITFFDQQNFNDVSKIQGKIYEFYYNEPFLKDHLVYNKQALMGVIHPSCVIEEYLKQKNATLPIELTRLEFIGGPVTPTEDDIIHIIVDFEEGNDQIGFTSKYYYKDCLHTNLCLKGQNINFLHIKPNNIDIKKMIKQGKRISSIDIDNMYNNIQDFTIGEMLKTIEEAYLINQNTIITKVNLINKLEKGNVGLFMFDPLVLSSCYFYAFFEEKRDYIFIPLMIENLQIFKPSTKIAYILTKINKKTPEYISFDSIVVDDTGEVFAEVKNASVKAVYDPAKLINADFTKDKKSKEISHPAVIKPFEKIDIAIIGISGRYPNAKDVKEFWENLKEGKDCITEIPKKRWDFSLYYDEDKDELGKTYSKWGGFLDDVDLFDPLFFNISPREAEIIDPQERIFLQCVYHTLEDAGYTREALGTKQSNVGVFVGVMDVEYQLYGVEETIRGKPIALNGNSSSIANRISYFFNFHGPCITLNTMCSSSLTAIHLACQSIRLGECSVAIAGGVNILIHPNKYLFLSQGKFLSRKGKCESFGQGGDGYVPSEGVGAVLLKPLSKAIEDKDLIYGIIKATAINHGGKTSGYSVPSPSAQAEVIGRTFREAGINPKTISYMEAHGTGTLLGDPIEIAGLSHAFQEYTTDNQFCAIGSVKSNIGHCESAAGIAGVTKVLLQLKNRQIAPSLHSEILNPNIEFAKTPFVVQQELKEWERPVITIDAVTKEYPRIAGVSSFGAGGSNAHIIIEEYIPKSQEQTAIPEVPQQPALIILSAKDEVRLKEQAERVITAIQERQLTDANLADMAYTLQVGREAMEERLGFITGSIEELAGKLAAFLTGQNDIEDMYRGQVKRNQDSLTVFTADEDLQKAVESWVNKGKYSKLLDLWTKGLVFDWNRLYRENKPRRISLPTYPFAKEHYWVEMEPKVSGTGTITTTAIHPLLQQNTSDLSEQRYSSTFTGQEFFLKDHVVMGQRVLPGVAYLEMARAAVAQAVGAEADLTVIRLKDIVWVRPIIVGETPIQVHIGIYPQDKGELEYQIYHETQEEETGVVVYSQGKGILTTMEERFDLDLKAIKAECSEKILPGKVIYEAYRALGIEYGPGFRGIEQIYVGQEQLLAKLALPSSIAATMEQFVLHPGIMDAALQTSIGLSDFERRKGFDSKENKPALPFALDELEVFSNTDSVMWAWVRYSEGSKIGDKVPRLDIDLCDEKGNICVRLKRLSSRVLEGDIQTSNKKQIVPVEAAPEAREETIMLTPVWDAVSIKRSEPLLSSAAQIVMIGGTKKQQNAILKQYSNVNNLEIKVSDSVDEITQKLAEYGTIHHILWIAPYSLCSLVDEALIEKQNQGVLQVFRIIKALLKLGYGTKELGWSLITNRTQAIYKNEEVYPTHAGLPGLVGSMAKEYLNWKIRLVDLQSNKDLPITDIFTLPFDSEGNPLAYRSGEWYQQQLVPVVNAPIQQTLYKTGGVYVVIGGAGGIGEAWSEYVIRTYQARVIWIGRRAKDDDIQAKIDRLAVLGPKPQYITADATKRNALEEAYHEIKQSYSQINGVVHSAIVLLDKSLMNMTEEQFQAGLSAKVNVSVRIAQVFQNETLDFVLFFSSMQSFLKAAGQSNYAAGCTFKDAFAHQLNLEWTSRVKVMNWGYWGNVGIVASEVYREKMAQAGIGSLEPLEAMEALERLLVGPIDQIALIKTMKPLIMEAMNPKKQIMVYPEDLPSVIGNISKKSISI